MSSIIDHSKILIEAYEKFLLPLGGKRVPTPYRRNEIGSLQKISPEFQGKSSPEVLRETTERLAKEQGFDLNKASVEEIRNFMMKNKLGIDCSGFAYRVLNQLAEKTKKKPLTSFGFPHVGRANVAKLTDPKFTKEISLQEIKPGDLLKMNSAGDILHCLVITKREGNVVKYIHSSSVTKPNGVHQSEMIINNSGLTFEEDLGDITYNPTAGDGLRRLKIFSKIG